MESNVTKTLDLADSRGLRNEVLNESQFKQRIKILYLMEEDAEVEGKDMHKFDKKELDDLIKIEKLFKACKLEDQLLDVHRIRDDTAYYQIKFSKSAATIVKGDEVFDFIKTVPDDMTNITVQIKQSKALSENNDAVARRLQSGEVERFSVEKIGTDLMNAASLLNVARLACRSHPCAYIVVDSLSKYQVLIRETNITLDEVVSNCVMSLILHKKALAAVLDNDLSSAVKGLEVANELATKSLVVVKLRKEESQALALYVQDAIKGVSMDESKLSQDKSEVAKQRDDFQAKQSKYKAQKEQLNKLIEERKSQEKELYDQMQSMSNKMLALGIVKAFAEPLTKAALASINPAGAAVAELGTFAQVAGNFAGAINQQLKTEEENLNKVKKQVAENKAAIAQKEGKLKNAQPDSDEYKKLESELDQLKIEKAGLDDELQNTTTTFGTLKEEMGKQQDSLQKMMDGHQENLKKCQDSRYQLEKDQIQILGDLEETLTRIESCKVQENSLDLALDCLHAATVTLARVSNIFDNFIRFWALQINLFEQILIIAKTNDSCTTEKVLTKMKESFLRWLALAGINYVAKVQISGVINKIHDIQSKIPDIKAGHELAKEFSKDSREFIKKEIEDLKNGP
jgi:septal ring factor EnvC (AmiA/AmiB activator)